MRFEGITNLMGSNGAGSSTLDQHVSAMQMDNSYAFTFNQLNYAIHFAGHDVARWDWTSQWLLAFGPHWREYTVVASSTNPWYGDPNQPTRACTDVAGVNRQCEPRRSRFGHSAQLPWE